MNEESNPMPAAARRRRVIRRSALAAIVAVLGLWCGALAAREGQRVTIQYDDGSTQTAMPISAAPQSGDPAGDDSHAPPPPAHDDAPSSGARLDVGVNIDSNTEYATDAAWANLFNRFI